MLDVPGRGLLVGRCDEDRLASNLRLAAGQAEGVTAGSLDASLRADGRNASATGGGVQAPIFSPPAVSRRTPQSGVHRNLRWAAGS
jgi:hypothetical protein